MLKSFRYLSALIVVCLPFYSCSDSIIPGGSDEYTLSGTGEKTPLEISVTLKDTENGTNTRALNGSFEENDQLIAYVQQVEVSDDTPPTYTAKISKLVSWTLNEAAISGATTESNEMTVTSDNSDGKLGMTLYWDDFSNTTDDIRGDKRLLRVGYGFCYNGGDPTTGLTSSNESSGKIEGWSVKSDQSTADQSNVRKSDLLWAGPQTPIKYEHIVAERKPLPVTYTHAMSKVTIELVLGEGFDVDDDGKTIAFGGNSTTPTLFANKVVTEADAINQTLTTTVAANDDLGITMYLVEEEKITNDVSNKTRVYEAIIAPTVMKAGKKLAEVEVDGNKYELKLTDELLKALPTGVSGNAWATQLYGYTETEISDPSGKTVSKNSDTNQASESSPDGITLSGINYRLIATLNKQQITVSASIRDWTDVNASATGTISFNSDITTKGDIADALKTGGFDVYKSNDVPNFNNLNTNGKTTTLSWDTNDNKWTYAPVVYWAGQSDVSYFRALSPAGTITDNIVKQGTDVLWGYACDDDGNDGGRVGTPDEVAINPRTGDVPLHFEHAMSKVSFVLTTSNETAKAVDLAGARISIINLYNQGEIGLKSGCIGELSMNLTSPEIYTLNKPVDANCKLLDQVVIPQYFTTDKDGYARATAPTFYQTGELTKIYNDGTSLSSGGGSGRYYLTSSLETVTYAQSELTPIYTDGTSIDDQSGSSETYVTTSLVQVAAQAEVNYTAAEVEEINAPHRILGVDTGGKNPGDDGYVTTWKLVTDENDIAPGASGYITTYEYPSDYTPITIADIKTPAIPAHYRVDEHSLKATTSTFKCYKTNSGSEQHNPGDLKSRGTKIMMYITLADGTRYTVDLATCKAYTEDSDGNKTYGSEITYWQRGRHYTYTINLVKESITFRALVKDWTPTTGSGNATLEWD